jgi:hypothetical protein
VRGRRVRAAGGRGSRAGSSGGAGRTGCGAGGRWCSAAGGVRRANILDLKRLRLSVDLYDRWADMYGIGKE